MREHQESTCDDFLVNIPDLFGLAFVELLDLNSDSSRVASCSCAWSRHHLSEVVPACQRRSDHRVSLCGQVVGLNRLRSRARVAKFRIHRLYIARTPSPNWALRVRPLWSISRGQVVIITRIAVQFIVKLIEFDNR